MTETAIPWIVDQMKGAAYQQMIERQNDFTRVAQIVLGANRGRHRVTDMVQLGEDYVVEVTEPKGRTLWTTVVADQRSSRYYETQEEAVLHLIARRHDPDPNTSAQAAFYAGRVLGTNRIPRDH